MKYTIEQDAFAVTSFGSNRRDRNGRLRPLGIRVRTR
jgi:hypothetical protein